MNWLNIHTDTLRSEEYLGAEPVERATWLNLMAWCVSQENGGTIEGAATWGERKWMQVCGITKAEATLVSKLFKIGSDGNMVVSLYPSDKEEEVKAKREVARANGKKGGRPPKESTSVPEKTNVGSENNQRCKAEGKEKGREGKEKEKEKEDIAPASGKPEPKREEISWSKENGWSGITTADSIEWGEAYPACDQKRNLAAMHQWLLSNPAKAKKKAWRRFITNWLGRKQESGGDIASNGSKAKHAGIQTGGFEF